MGGAGGGGCDDCAGALAWVKPAGGGDRDYAYGVSVAADGSVYVTGTFGDDATWNPGEADATERSASQNDMFVARYAADGSLLWVKDTAGNAEDEGSRAGVVDGGVVVTGWVTDGGLSLIHI